MNSLGGGGRCSGGGGVLEERAWSPQMEADRKSTRHGQSRGKKGMTMNEGTRRSQGAQGGSQGRRV